MPQYQTPAGIITYTCGPRFVCMLLPGINRVQVSYGVYSPKGSPRYHYGIDVDTPDKDWRVFAVAGGKVLMSTMVTNKNDKTWEWGNFVCILDGQGYRHYYCHLASRAVVVGQAVKAGDVLGVMGKTGNAAGDAQAEHVHYEVRQSPYNSAHSVDPTPWCGIPNKQGQTIETFDRWSVETMKALEIKNNGTNVEGFNTPDVNNVAVSHLERWPGRYMVYETGRDLGSVKASLVRVAAGDGNIYKVWVAEDHKGATSLADVPVSEAETLWGWYGDSSTAGGVPKNQYDTAVAERDAANRKVQALEGYAGQVAALGSSASDIAAGMLKTLGD